MPIMFVNDSRLVDEAKLTFGDSGDLEIYHDGSNSYIDETGTGVLYIRSGEDIRLQTTTGENMIYCRGDSAVNLYYDDTLRLATTAQGINVSDDITLTWWPSSCEDFSYDPMLYDECNMFGFTNFCPMALILKKMGVKE